MPQRIAIISEHASPLVAVGGIDSGGQNIYVAETARQLAARGCSVDVFTRKDEPDLPEVVDWLPGVRVIHVPAGPAAFVRKEDLLPLMPEFAAFVQRFAATQRYDLAHAHFFMSGLVAMQLKASLGLPFVVTFQVDAVITDNGFYSEANVGACEKNKITPYLDFGRDQHNPIKKIKMNILSN